MLLLSVRNEWFPDDILSYVWAHYSFLCVVTAYKEIQLILISSLAVVVMFIGNVFKTQKYLISRLHVHVYNKLPLTYSILTWLLIPKNRSSLIFTVMLFILLGVMPLDICLNYLSSYVIEHIYSLVWALKNVVDFNIYGKFYHVLSNLVYMFGLNLS